MFALSHNFFTTMNIFFAILPFFVVSRKLANREQDAFLFAYDV